MEIPTEKKLINKVIYFMGPTIPPCGTRYSVPRILQKNSILPLTCVTSFTESLRKVALKTLKLLPAAMSQLLP